MPVVAEHPTFPLAHHAQNLQSAEIARDLALMDDLEAFVQALPKRMEGRNPTTEEIRTMAYDDGEANSL